MRYATLIAFLAFVGGAGTAAAAAVPAGQESHIRCSGASSHPSQIEFAGADRALAGTRGDVHLVLGAADPEGLVVNACPAAPPFASAQRSDSAGRI
jgi:hypothetical protein